MKIGDVFSSCDEFNNALAEYTQQVHNGYWIRDARTIVNQRKRHPDTVKNAKDSLKYYYVLIACIRGGRKYEPKKEHSTRKCSTGRLNCPAAIHLHMTSCRQFLIVTKVCDAHNHKTSKAYLSTLPRQRAHLPSLLKGSPCEILKASGRKNSPEKRKKSTRLRNLSHSKLIQRKKQLTKHEKFKIMDEQGKIISKLCSEVSVSVFYERLNFITNKIKEWSDGTIFNNCKNEPVNEIQETNDKDITDIENDEDKQGDTENICTLQNNIHQQKKNNRGRLRKNEHSAKTEINIKKPARILKRGRQKGYGKTAGSKKKKKTLYTNNTSFENGIDIEDRCADSVSERTSFENELNIEDRCADTVFERLSFENGIDIMMKQEETENEIITEYLEIDDSDSEIYFEEYLDEDCLDL